ncbi:MAG TPA: succinate dehydrogenase cytochrome b subunit [Thermoanaerobaculia bacterium]|nr:succinate dehydrogenase cytochrome b subunit [Thermoanaerobaculia bacterium]
MTWAGNFYRSAVGKKAVMAVSGAFLFGWIFLHMVGNLKLYLGAEHLNEYARWLRAIGTPAMPETGTLWVMRVLLLVALVLHVHAAVALTKMNLHARPVDYHDRGYVAASYAARTMRWGGVIILLFIIYHLLHLTTGQAHHNFIPDDPYYNVVSGFQIWWVAAAYIAANVALGFHLFHGVWSMFGSVGWVHPRFNAWRRNFATTFAVIITAGNVSFPLAVLTGLVR